MVLAVSELSVETVALAETLLGAETLEVFEVFGQVALW